MVTAETAKDRYDFLAHQIGGLAVSLMTRATITVPSAANLHGYQIQSFLDIADCALEEAEARATAAEERERQLREALDTFDEYIRGYDVLDVLSGGELFSLFSPTRLILAALDGSEGE